MEEMRRRPGEVSVAQITPTGSDGSSTALVEPGRSKLNSEAEKTERGRHVKTGQLAAIKVMDVTETATVAAEAG
ncbi:unnamed protein product [Boreogadus saida]